MSFNWLFRPHGVEKRRRPSKRNLYRGQFVRIPFYKMWDAFIRDLFSDTYTLRIQYEYTKPQCVGVAKVVTNKRVSHFTSINQFMGLNEDNP